MKSRGVLMVAALAPVVGWAAEVAAKPDAQRLRGFGLAESAASPPYARVLLVFLLIAGFAWGAVWLLKRYGLRFPGIPGNPVPGTATNINLVARTSLPGGITCHVVQAQGRDVLITVSRSGVASLVLGDTVRKEPAP